MASLIPGYEYDIFISYRQKDNKGERWVTEFVNALKTELESKFKEDVSVYFDENPHDGLLETHDVDDSLKAKLKCLVFIPIISQTYCDPKSFAWNSEFLAFKRIASEDQVGLKVNLKNSNVASRILPVRINDLDLADLTLLESELGGKVRSVDFIYKSAGVNRPLITTDNPEKNLNKTQYRDQINKVANAIKEIITVLITPEGEWPQRPITLGGERASNPKRRIVAAIITALALVMIAAYFFVPSWSAPKRKLDKSVAVLPFENLSGDPGQEYFSDGIAEGILSALLQVKDLKVPGRISSFRFRGKSVDLREVGEKLNVSTVLEGSVRRQGNRVKINTDLISVEDGYSLWSQEFDRTIDDMFAIQDEIATAITQKLKATLLQNEKPEVGKEFTKSREAYDAMLKGRYFWNRRELRESEKYYKQAIKFDSTFAPAYAGLAETYAVFSFFRFASPDQSMPKAQAAAEKAMQLDSLLALPYLVLAFKSGEYDFNPERAKKYFTKGLSLNPNYSEAHYWYCHYLEHFEGDFNHAIAEARKAVELEPLAPIPYANLASPLFYAKKYKEAQDNYRICLELNKQNSGVNVAVGMCFIGLGKLNEARKAIEQCTDLTRARAVHMAVYFLVKDGNYNKAQKLFMELVKESQSERSETEYFSPIDLAKAASFLGQKDLAYEYFKKAFKEHDGWLTTLLMDPVRLPNDIFTDPRNVELMAQQFGKIPNTTYNLPVKGDR